MKRAIIVHGFKGKPDTNWKPWLKRQLEEMALVPKCLKCRIQIALLLMSG